MTEQRGSSEEPHQTRQVAESFGVDAARYDRARPPYPVELISRIVELSPGTHVLDVGCGTGIQARQFAAAGCQVLGVDPDTRMAEFARASGLDVEVSTFEEWEPASRTFDAVVAGQAWHWVDPAAGAVKAARVLRGGGPLALFAHVFEPPAEIARVQDEVIRRVVPDLPADVRPSGGGLAGYREMFDKPAAGIAATGEFGEVAQWRFDWERSYTRDQWLDLLPTIGLLTRLSADRLATVLDTVGAAIDQLGGGFTMPYTTLALAATRGGPR